MKYLPSKTLLIVIALGVALGGSALVFWTSQKPAASFERTGALGKTGSDADTLSQDENVTTKTAQNLLSEYLIAQEGRDALTEEERVRVAEDLAEEVRQRSIREDAYILGDLPLTQDSLAAYRAYGNELGAIFSRYENNGLESEVVIMKRAFAKKDRVELTKIMVNADAYRSLTDDLANVSVPRSLADIHLRFLNSYAGIAASLSDISVVFEDSLRGMTGIKLYGEHLNGVVAATESLRTFFSQNKIVFAETEPGFPLARVLP